MAGFAEIRMLRAEETECAMKFIDPRDGNEYKTVILRDGRKWLAENLRYEIRGVTGSYPNLVGSFPADTSPPDEMLESNPAYDSQKYGRLYTWEAAQLAAPTGWHVPTAQEWKRLFDCYGGWGKDIHSPTPKNTDQMEILVRETEIQFGGCLRASNFRDPQVAISYTYFGDFMGARFWSSSKPTFLSGFDARKYSGIYFLIRPWGPSAHRTQEVPDYAFSVRCIAD
jgi:uncharacterized protein (TIGR02145 family)